jgi:hypothetical protein
VDNATRTLTINTNNFTIDSQNAANTLTLARNFSAMGAFDSSISSNSAIHSLILDGPSGSNLTITCANGPRIFTINKDLTVTGGNTTFTSQAGGSSVTLPASGNLLPATDTGLNLPTVSGQSGKFLTTDGATLSWGVAGGGSSPTYAAISYNNGSGTITGIASGVEIKLGFTSNITPVAASGSWTIPSATRLKFPANGFYLMNSNFQFLITAPGGGGVIMLTAQTTLSTVGFSECSGNSTTLQTVNCSIVGIVNVTAFATQQFYISFGSSTTVTQADLDFPDPTDNRPIITFYKIA